MCIRDRVTAAFVPLMLGAGGLALRLMSVRAVAPRFPALALGVTLLARLGGRRMGMGMAAVRGAAPLSLRPCAGFASFAILRALSTVAVGSMLGLAPCAAM